jgi:hypothetical protein
VSEERGMVWRRTRSVARYGAFSGRTGAAAGARPAGRHPRRPRGPRARGWRACRGGAGASRVHHLRIAPGRGGSVSRPAMTWVIAQHTRVAGEARRRSWSRTSRRSTGRSRRARPPHWSAPARPPPTVFATRCTPRGIRPLATAGSLVGGADALGAGTRPDWRVRARRAARRGSRIGRRCGWCGCRRSAWAVRSCRGRPGPSAGVSAVP